MHERALSFWFVILLSVIVFVCGAATATVAVEVKDENATLDVGTKGHEISAWVDDQDHLKQRDILDGPKDFFGSVGDTVTKYARSALDEFAKTGLAKEIESFKNTMHTIVTFARKLESDLQPLLAGRDSEGHHNHTELDEKFKVIAEELQVMFPAPDTAPSHEQRKNMTEHTLTRVGEELAAFALTLGMSKEQSVGLKKDFENLKPFVRNLVVTIGDLAEQHPAILEAILFMGIGMLFPGSWFLRPLLSLFGFGPQGPLKGSAAAWAQRVFFGAVVPKGSWFSVLQGTAMKAVPPNVGEAIVGGVLAGIGAIGGIFQGGVHNETAAGGA